MGWQVDDNGRLTLDSQAYVANTPTSGAVDAGYYDKLRQTAMDIPGTFEGSGSTSYVVNNPFYNTGNSFQTAMDVPGTFEGSGSQSYIVNNTPSGVRINWNPSTPSELSLNDYVKSAESTMRRLGLDWANAPQAVGSGNTVSSGVQGYPRETSADLINADNRRIVGKGLRAYGGGYGFGLPTGKPMPYFEGLKDQYGMSISPYDSKYWKMPDKPVLNLPTYTPPARNEGRISELSQKAGAVGVGKLGRALTTALSQARGMGDNPMAEQTTRSALRGYGEGLDSVMGQAQQIGLQQYEKEYQPIEEANRINYEGKMKSSLADYQTQNQRINAMYEAALKDYFGR